MSPGLNCPGLIWPGLKLWDYIGWTILYRSPQNSPLKLLVTIVSNSVVQLHKIWSTWHIFSKILSKKFGFLTKLNLYFWYIDTPYCTVMTRPKFSYVGGPPPLLYMPSHAMLHMPKRIRRTLQNNPRNIWEEKSKKKPSLVQNKPWKLVNNDDITTSWHETSQFESKHGDFER